MRTSNIGLTLISIIVLFLLGGCGTTGKNIAPVVKMHDMTNCIVNINPTVETESGAASNTSANTTDLKDLLDLEFPVEEIMGAAIEKAVDTKLLKDVIPEDNAEVIDSNVIPDSDEGEDVSSVTGESLGTWSCNAYEDKAACRLPVNFSENDFPITFVFDNSCGSFDIPTAAGDNRDTDEYNRDGYVYFMYEKGTPAVFPKKGCAATKVEAFQVSE